MKSSLFSFWTIALGLSISLLLPNCSGEPSTSSNGGANNGGAQDTTTQAPPPPANHSCALPDKILDGNAFWIRDQDLLAVIRADSTTRDAELGDSHRLFELYDTKTCQLVQNQTLPVNVSPDFPYYIANVLYNKTSQLVGIRGFNTLYIYDVAGRKMQAPLKPRFAGARPEVDAQSGMIQHLEIWETYLIGYAQDQGVFVFDLTDKAKPRPVMPLAEYLDEETGSYNSLFLLPTAGGASQGVIPSYDRANGKFSLNTLFTQPVALSTNVPKSARNNQYLVLRAQGDNSQAYAINLAARKRIELPADVQSQPTQAILQWVRANTR